ncbi:MAG: D-alanyl-D-alanine carboxypeptidase [Aestuariivirgaceae bacterium]
MLVKVCASSGRSGAWRCARIYLIVPALLLVAGLMAEPAQAAKKRSAASAYRPAFSAMAIDAYSGKPLYERSPDEPRYPASLTKMMTLYLVFQDLQAGKINRNSRFTVSAYAASRAPSKLGLRPGQTIRVEDAILALVTKSANDVAATIGENLGGSEARFAERMTRTARSIGMTRTTFRNASGLPDEQQRTTARDMATLGLRLQRDFPKEFAYFSRPSFTFAGRVVRTHNRLLGRMRGVDGIKTGYTRASGFNLVTSAGRDGRRLVGVVMGGASGGARNRYMAAMLETAFPKAGKGKVIALAAGKPPGFNAAAAVAVAAATGDTPAPKMRLAGVPVPKPKPETEEPDMALVPAEVAADSGEDEEAVAQDSAQVADQPGGDAVSRPTETPPKPMELAAAAPAEPPAEAPPTESSPQGDFGTTGLNPIDPSEDAVSVGKSDSLFVMRQTVPVPAPGKTITTVKPARASLAAAPTIEPASLTRGAAEDLSAHSATWNIQIGAFPSSSAAQERIDAAQAAAGDLLSGKVPFTMPVSRGNDTIFRARFSGFDESQAREACKRLSRKGVGCFPLAPHS